MTPLRLLSRDANLVRVLLGRSRAGATMLGLREGLIRFLEEHPGYVCAACLASSVGAPLSPTTMITLGLHRADGFATADDVCSHCYRLSRVIKAERTT